MTGTGTGAAKDSWQPPPLYAITNVADGSGESASRAVCFTKQLLEAGVTLVQLRAKALPAGPLSRLSETLRESFETFPEARLLLNDRPDIAAVAGLHGVHLGQTDVPVAVARDILGPDAIIGSSSHAPDQTHAQSLLPGVDYVAFGPLFDSPTKAGVRTPRGLDALAEACRESALPVVAIGGITRDTVGEIWRIGAASAAVISDLTAGSSVSETVAEYLRLAADFEAGRSR